MNIKGFFSFFIFVILKLVFSDYCTYVTDKSGAYCEDSTHLTKCKAVGWEYKDVVHECTYGCVDDGSSSYCRDVCSFYFLQYPSNYTEGVFCSHYITKMRDDNVENAEYSRIELVKCGPNGVKEEIVELCYDSCNNIPYTSMSLFDGYDVFSYQSYCDDDCGNGRKVKCETNSNGDDVLFCDKNNKLYYIERCEEDCDNTGRNAQCETYCQYLSGYEFGEGTVCLNYINYNIPSTEYRIRDVLLDYAMELYEDFMNTTIDIPIVTNELIKQVSCHSTFHKCHPDSLVAALSTPTTEFFDYGVCMYPCFELWDFFERENVVNGHENVMKRVVQQYTTENVFDQYEACIALCKGNQVFFSLTLTFTVLLLTFLFA